MRKRAAAEMLWLAAFAAVASAVLAAGCGASAPAGGTSPARGGAGASGGPAGDEVPPEPAPCVAWDSDEADPVRRWLPAFPIERGGVVLTFTGTAARQMDVEAVMEMRGIEGYEAVACGTAVVLWLPGVECETTAPELAVAVEEGTSMRHHDESCFLLDEVRPRLIEECGLGLVPVDRCP